MCTHLFRRMLRMYVRAPRNEFKKGNCSRLLSVGFFPKNGFFVQNHLARRIECVLDFRVLLHSARAVPIGTVKYFETKNTSAKDNNASTWQLMRGGEQSPSAIHGAKSHNRATVDVIAVLRVHVERVFAHTLANLPNVVEASDVHIVSGNNLRIEKPSLIRRKPHR